MRRALFTFLLPLAAMAEPDTVVLLHGLASNATAMRYVESTLEGEGYRVVNIDYPSMSKTLEELAIEVRAQIDAETADAGRVHFVTHSMGGIILRMIQRDEPVENIGRVVMISPPNHGAMAVDLLQGMPGAAWGLGPAGRQLAEKNNELLASLGPAEFEVGVIAGSLGLEPFMSSMIPGPDDGVLSVESTKLDGMADFVVVHDAHPLLVFNGDAMEQTVSFLKDGCFVQQSQPAKDENPWARNWTHRR